MIFAKTVATKQQVVSKENIDIANFPVYEEQMSRQETDNDVVPLDTVMKIWEYVDDSSVSGIVDEIENTAVTQSSPAVETEEMEFVTAAQLKAVESFEIAQQTAHERKKAIYRQRRNILIILGLMFVIIWYCPREMWWILFVGWLILGGVFAVALIPLIMRNTAGDSVMDAVVAAIDWMTSGPDPE